MINRLIELAEEILCLISNKRKISIKEIQETLDITEDKARIIIDILLRFGFVESDKTRRHIMLSEPCKSFFKEMNV